MEFITEKKGDGYRKDQVDAYIRELRQTYQKMYEAYQAMQRQCGDLNQRYADLLHQHQTLEAEVQHLRQQAQMYFNASAAGQAGMQYPAQQPYPPAYPPYGPYGPYETQPGGTYPPAAGNGYY